MIEVSDAIVIDAPVESVFAFIDDPANHVTVTPSLAAVRNVERLENGGKRLEHTFRMAGVSLDGELVQTTHNENERMVFDMRGQLAGELELAFEAVDDATRLTYTARYEMPNAVVEAVARPFVRRYNERELATTLQNVESFLETEA